jgi:hypothetical protein
MKSFAALATLLFVTSRLLADTSSATQPVDPNATPVKPVDPVVVPSTVTPPVVTTTVIKKPVKVIIYTIPGMTIQRANGTFLGLQVVDAKFKISFYDQKKKPMAPDVTGGLARWPNPRGTGDNRSPLNLSGNSLLSARPALPPYPYNVFLTLLKGTGETAAPPETFTVMFRG